MINSLKSTPSPPVSVREKIHWGSHALSSPVSSAKRVPQIDRSQVNPEILKAAEGMESLFIDYMLKVMRQTVPKNEMDLESPATDLYRGMLDTEFAEKVSHQGGVGLADQIIAYLVEQGYNQDQGQGVPGKEKP
jgi:flagellar protein FlgJ